MIPESFFEEALRLAELAAQNGEVPVGALVCEKSEKGWKIIGRGQNAIVGTRDASGHAELTAIREACAYQKSERLSGCVLISSLEPCLMCTGAALLARVEHVYFFTPVFTGIGMREILSYADKSNSPINHSPGIELVEKYQESSAGLIRSFFQQKRKNRQILETEKI